MAYGDYQPIAQEKEMTESTVSKERGVLLIQAMEKIKEVLITSIELAKQYPEAAHQEFDGLTFDDPSQKETLIRLGKEMDAMMDEAEKGLER
jgi:hypothetical protein